MLVEWIKTISVIRSIQSNLDNSFAFTLDMFRTLNGKRTVYEDIGFAFESKTGQGEGLVTFTFPDKESQEALLPVIRPFLKKAISCVGCQTCEAECLFGAISTLRNKKIQIDASKCVHCRTCYEISKACWRFRSMGVPETSKSTETGINSYKNFGLRENETYGWVSTLVELGEDFFPWTPTHPLGKKMVEAARLWFVQAELIDSSRKPKKLLELFREKGTDILWLGACVVCTGKTTSLIKWFVTDIEFGVSFTRRIDGKTFQLFSDPWSFDNSWRTLCVKGHIVKIALGLAASESEIALQI